MPVTQVSSSAVTVEVPFASRAHVRLPGPRRPLRSERQLVEEVAELLRRAGIGCGVEVEADVVSLLALEDPADEYAARAVAASVPGVAAVQVLG